MSPNTAATSQLVCFAPSRQHRHASGHRQVPLVTPTLECPGCQEPLATVPRPPPPPTTRVSRVRTRQRGAAHARTHVAGLFSPCAHATSTQLGTVFLPKYRSETGSTTSSEVFYALYSDQRVCPLCALHAVRCTWTLRTRNFPRAAHAVSGKTQFFTPRRSGRTAQVGRTNVCVCSKTFTDHQ